jgi:hypothetical protein
MMGINGQTQFNAIPDDGIAMGNSIPIDAGANALLNCDEVFSDGKCDGIFIKGGHSVHDFSNVASGYNCYFNYDEFTFRKATNSNLLEVSPYSQQADWTAFNPYIYTENFCDEWFYIVKVTNPDTGHIRQFLVEVRRLVKTYQYPENGAHISNVPAFNWAIIKPISLKTNLLVVFPPIQP